MSGTSRHPWAPASQLATLTWVALTLSLVFAAFSISKPLTMDQADPVALHGAILAAEGHGALGNGDNLEVAHPPLNKHLLALVFQTVGQSDLSARGIGLACFLLTAALVFGIGKRMFAGQDSAAIASLATALFLLNPFILQHFLLVEQSTTILPLFLALLLWVFLRFEASGSRAAFAALPIVFALCLWAYEFTPFFLAPALGLYLLATRGLWAAFLQTAWIVGLGLAIFVGTWLAYCELTGVDPMVFIDFTLRNKALNEDWSPESPLRWALNSYFGGSLRWTSGGFQALIALAAGARLWRLLKSRRAELADIIWVFSISLLLAALYKTPGIIRLQLPAYVFLTVVIAAFVVQALRASAARPPNWTTVVTATLALAAVLWATLGDALLIPRIRGYLIWSTAIPAILLFALFYFSHRHAREKSALQAATLAALALTFACNLALGMSQTGRYNTAPSWHEYGERGLRETVDWLAANVGNSIPVIRKDAAYYLQTGTHGLPSGWVYSRMLSEPDTEGGRAVLQRIENDRRIRILVLDPFSRSEVAIKLANTYFERTAQFGDFEIYIRREN